MKSCIDAGEILYRCSRCGNEYTEVIPALGHEYTEVITAPTCTEQGYTTHVCVNDASHNYVDNYTDALGHIEATREENRVEPTTEVDGSYDVVTYCTRCNEVLNRETIVIPKLPAEEPATLSYRTGTFGNLDLQEWPEPYIGDWEAAEQNEISMHYVDHMTETTVESENELIGRHGFAITTPFVVESDSMAAYDEVASDPYTTRPAIVLPNGYEVTAWNTDVDNSPLSECMVYNYPLADGRIVYYGGFPQITGDTTVHYLTIVKN